MDLSVWSFVLSVAGLILGFVSAYAHIKRFSIRAIKAGGDAAERWLKRIDEEADFYVANPSALIAYIAFRAIILLAIFVIGALLLKPGGGSSLPVPEWASSVLRLGLAFAFGHVVASLTETVSNVSRRARRLRSAAGSDG